MWEKAMANVLQVQPPAPVQPFRWQQPYDISLDHGDWKHASQDLPAKGLHNAWSTQVEKKKSVLIVCVRVCFLYFLN